MKRFNLNHSAHRVATALSTLAVVTSLLTGCGGHAVYSPSQLSSLNTQISSPVPVVTPTPTDNSTGTLPLYNYRIAGIGYTSVTVQVWASHTLKVRFTPGQQDQTVAGTGFAPEYSKLAVFINVGSTEQATPLLSNGMGGTNAQTSSVIDFSSSIPTPTGSCTTLAADGSCRQHITITVRKPNYDYFCYNGYYQYCPYTNVWSTHPWNGQLEIMTDETVGF